MSSATFQTASMSVQVVSCGEVLKAKRIGLRYVEPPRHRTDIHLGPARAVGQPQLTERPRVRRHRWLRASSPCLGLHVHRDLLRAHALSPLDACTGMGLMFEGAILTFFGSVIPLADVPVQEPPG